MEKKNSVNEGMPERKWIFIYTLVAVNTLVVFFLLWLFPQLFS